MASTVVIALFMRCLHAYNYRKFRTTSTTALISLGRRTWTPNRILRQDHLSYVARIRTKKRPWWRRGQFQAYCHFIQHKVMCISVIIWTKKNTIHELSGERTVQYCGEFVKLLDLVLAPRTVMLVLHIHTQYRVWMLSVRMTESVFIGCSVSPYSLNNRAHDLETKQLGGHVQ